jgi:hypothetical protein
VSPLQAGVAADSGIVRALLRLTAFGSVAVLVGGGVAAAYRWYSRQRAPTGAAALVGAGVVAVYLQTVGLYADVLTGTETSLFLPAVAAFNLGALAVGAVGGVVGLAVGDRIATDLVAVAGARELETGVSRTVRVVGRVSAVTLPEEIDDMAGYDPVSEEVKATLAGRTHLFPRGLTIAERRDRLVTRLKTDHDVGYIDVEMDGDGTVTYLALGSRVAGVGPTLAPGTAAVAVRADPAGGASPGDVVQLWRTEPEPARVATAELRAVDGDVATVALDESDATELDADATYRLVTLPTAPRAERSFAAAFRAAGETMGAVAVAPGNDLVGTPIADLDGTVVAVRPRDGPVEAVPARSRPIDAGDTVYVVARPDALRRLEAATGVEAVVANDTGT